jgi:hypothetical protein
MLHAMLEVSSDHILFPIDSPYETPTDLPLVRFVPDQQDRPPEDRPGQCPGPIQTRHIGLPLKSSWPMS